MSNNPYSKPDRFTQKAKSEGYAARSVYKLDEIDQRFKLLRGGMRVVDLGCYPGSWSRYIRERIGPKGNLVGVDLQEPKGIPGTFIAASVLDVSAEQLGACDVLVSDMAPNTTGDRFGDHLRQIILADRALELAVACGAGAFVCKVFEGKDAKAFEMRVREVFSQVKRVKPEAVRSNSVEFFVVATERKPHAAQKTS